MQWLDHILSVAVGWAWGPPLLVLLLGAGFLLTVYSRFLPFTRPGHALAVLVGRYDKSDDPGEITHFQALSTALSSTIGMGNIGGVAIAITQGGPGAVFWMWVAAIVGMATKYFTCTLAVLYRGRDSRGGLQGGPMYTIREGLGPRWHWLAVLFSVFGMVGCLSMFQTNQMAEILTETYQVSPWATGAVTVTVVALVILGGLKRIAGVAGKLVPAMVVLYLALAIYVLVMQRAEVPGVLAQIFHDAFSGTAAVGAFQGIAFKTVIQTGVKRAAFSNEAGIGTAPMAHGAARTSEPVREGLVAMLGPFIDTIVVCTLTALVILTAADWTGVGEDVKGASLTVQAFQAVAGQPGKLALVGAVMLFGLTTLFGYSYYGRKCFSFLFGAEHGRKYEVVYLVALMVGAVWSAEMVVNLLDTFFALMAIPNVLATLVLAPRVMKATRDYFARMNHREHREGAGDGESG